MNPQLSYKKIDRLNKILDNAETVITHDIIKSITLELEKRNIDKNNLTKDQLKEILLHLDSPATKELIKSINKMEKEIHEYYKEQNSRRYPWLSKQ